MKHLGIQLISFISVFAISLVSLLIGVVIGTQITSHSTNNEDVKTVTLDPPIPQVAEVNPDGTVTIGHKEVIDTSDWRTYRNEEYGYELNYPSDYQIQESPNDETGSQSVFIRTKQKNIIELFTSLDKADKSNVFYQDGISPGIISVDNINAKLVVYTDGICEEPNLCTPPLVSVQFYKNGINYLIFFNNQTTLSKLNLKILSTFKFIEPTDTSDWQTYRNEELGFEFKYPKRYGDIEYLRRNCTDAGELFRINFSNNDLLEFGGDTVDCAEGRGAGWNDFKYYTENNGDYFYHFGREKSFIINPTKIIKPLDIIVIGEQDLQLALGPEDRAALLNIDASKFKGIAFKYRNIPSNEVGIFDKILSTFKFIE